MRNAVLHVWANCCDLMIFEVAEQVLYCRRVTRRAITGHATAGELTRAEGEAARRNPEHLLSKWMQLPDSLGSGLSELIAVRNQKRGSGMGTSCHLQNGIVVHTLAPEPVRTLGSLSFAM